MTNKTDYHGRVMNILGDHVITEWGDAQLRTAYKFGHRDARHAAAEIVMELEAERDALLEALEGMREEGDWIGGEWVPTAQATAKADAAIAKAYNEGEDLE